MIIDISSYISKRWSTKTDRTLGLKNHNKKTQTIDGALMAVNRGYLEVNISSSFLRDRPYNQYETGSIEPDKPRRADQTGPVINTYEAPLSV